MTTAQMKTYLTVAKRLSFSAAAVELFISQSAVSRQIQAMERELGTKLFIREGNSIRLTLAGQILREELEQASLQYDALREQLKKLEQGTAGIFRLGLMENQAMIPELETALQALQTGSRQITVEYMPKERLYRELREGRLDAVCAVEESEMVAPDLDRLMLSKERICLAAAKRLAFGPVCSLDDLMERCRSLCIPFVELDDSLVDKPLRRGLALGRHAAFDPTVALAAMNLRTLEPTVAGGFAVACVNESNRLSLNKQVELIELTFLPWIQKILLWPRESENPLFGDFLAQFERRQ